MRRIFTRSSLAIGFLLCLVSGAFAVETFSFTTRDGEKIEGATFSRRTPDGVAFMTSEGVSKIAFEMLPDRLQKRFKYDPEETEAYRQRKAKAETERREAARQAELARRAERERKKFLPELDTTLRGTVLQVLDDGVLLHKSRATRPGKGLRTRKVQTDGPTTLSPNRKRTYRTVVEEVDQDLPLELGSGTVFLASKSLAETALDGQGISVLVYSIGRFKYVDKNGADRTVARFTTDEELAIAYGESELAKARASR